MIPQQFPAIRTSRARVALLVVAAAMLIGRGALADDPPGLAGGGAEPGNAMCPVMTDEPIDPDMHTDHEGRRVFFCCARCRKQFRAAPASFVANLPAVMSVAQAGPATAMSGAGTPRDDGGGKGRGRGRGGDDVRGGEGGRGDGLSGGDDDSAQGFDRVIRFAGRFHPIAVHFPIALVFVAVFAELLRFIARRETLAPTARFCVHLGTVWALVAMALGLAAEEFTDYSGALHDVLERHEFVGILSSVLLVGVSGLCEWANRSRKPAVRYAYLGALVLSALLIGITGHLGATLIYGPNHFAF